MWIQILIGLLGVLLNWWLNRKASGAPATPRDIRRTNHILGLAKKIEAIAVTMGCSTGGEIDEDEEPTVAMGAVEGPGDWLTDKVVGMLISNVAVPYLLKKVTGIPGQSPEWEACLMQAYKESQA